MKLSEEQLRKIEEDVDLFLFDLLNESIPRYKFIYHINLVYIDFVINNKLLFTYAEKHFISSLSYNTFLAYKKLKEEDIFEYEFDEDLYLYCYQFLMQGTKYSMLCDEFPKAYSGKSSVFLKGTEISFVENEPSPRKNYDFMTKYKIRKALSYTLQMTAGKLNSTDFEDAVLVLADAYTDFWNENMFYEDFEPYSRLDWGGVTLFFIRAAMRRFLNSYRADFNTDSFSSERMMILISEKGKNKIIDHTASVDQKNIDDVLNDYIYKPLGNGFYPKSNVSDAPIIQTKDGFLFVNPLVLLFNDSIETRLLNYLRKYDKKRYLIVKDKLKERVIPLIEALVKLKFPKVRVITNFELPIPNERNRKRELDIMIIDEDGFVLYIEIKHFYNPFSYAESKSIDKQLQEALNKTADQLYAIQFNWELIKQRYRFNTEIKDIQAIVVSHQYLGRDVEINDRVPIVNPPAIIESIAESNSIEEFYLANKEFDEIYPQIKMISKDLTISYAKQKFKLKMEALDPHFEVLFIKAYRKMVSNNIQLHNTLVLKNIDELADAILNKRKQSQS